MGVEPKPFTGSRKPEEIDRALSALGGQEWLWEQIASLRDLDQIAKDLNCSPRALYRWRDVSEDRKAEWSAALKVSGDAFAAEGKGILDTLHKAPGRLESAAVALANARATSRMKIAAARHPEAWGERAPAPVVNVNIGSLHLEALKAHGSMTLQGKPMPALLSDPTKPPIREIVQHWEPVSEPITPPDSVVESQTKPPAPPVQAEASGSVPKPAPRKLSEFIRPDFKVPTDFPPIWGSASEPSQEQEPASEDSQED